MTRPPCGILTGIALWLALSACGREQRNGARLEMHSDTLAVRPAGADGTAPRIQGGALYYGTSDPGWAWLLLLDFDRGEGSRYDPGAPIRLCQVRRDAEGSVSWSSFPAAAIVEHFEGKLAPGGLRGMIRFTRSATGKVVDSVAIRLDSISLAPSTTETTAGLYSNVTYVARAGDLTGAEVLVLRGGDQPVVIFTEYAGTPSGPWGMTDVRWVGDTLNGAYGSPPPFRIKLVRAGNTLRLGDRVLKKQGDLRDALRPKAQPVCGAAR